MNSTRRMPKFVSLAFAVDAKVKSLKTKVFIIKKSLDTAFPPLIRFLPESSDGISNHRWNYSPLKEKAVSVAGGLFRLFLSLRSKPLRCEFPGEVLLRLMHAARRASGLAANGGIKLSLRSKPLRCEFPGEVLLRLMHATPTPTRGHRAR